MELLVVGGGPVGLFAATAAAQRGHDVTLFERRAGDGDKACGEGLMPSARASLASVGVQPDGRPFWGIRYLDASGEHQVHAGLPSGPGLGARRTELVRALRAGAADAGVTVISTSIEEVESSDAGVRAFDRDGAQHSADALLGCDGLGSTVRRAIGMERPATGPRRYGLVAHFAVEPWSSDVEVYWGRTGEAYVTPVGDELVGVALLGGRGESFGDRIGELVSLEPRLRFAAPVGRVLGAGPMRRVAAWPVVGRVALVGDAAGYVDALTGEGLAVGFRGALAAISAIEADHIESYPAEWRRITRQVGWLTDALVRSTTNSPARELVVPLASAVPQAFRRLVSVLN